MEPLSADAMHAPGRLRGRPLAAALAAVLLLCGAGVGAAEEAASEYAVKAAFLVNFARLVEWPDRALRGRDALAICVLGDEFFSGGGREGPTTGNVSGRDLVVRALEDAAGAPECGVVFVTEGAGERAQDVLAAVAGRAVLTVGEDEDFIRAGGVIRFFEEDRKVRFAINPDAAKPAGLRISSRLLRLARMETP